jgi:hypothetical protein
MTTGHVAEQVQALELSLLHRDFSGNPDALEQLLAADFREISPTGTPVSRQEVMRWILNKNPADSWTLTDITTEALGDDAVLLAYHAHRTGPAASGSKGAWHCSLWRFNAGLQCWQLAFHQSTRVA